MERVSGQKREHRILALSKARAWYGSGIREKGQNARHIRLHGSGAIFPVNR